MTPYIIVALDPKMSLWNVDKAFDEEWPTRGLYFEFITALFNYIYVLTMPTILLQINLPGCVGLVRTIISPRDKPFLLNEHLSIRSSSPLPLNVGSMDSPEH